MVQELEKNESGQDLLTISNLTFGYTRKRTILENLDFRVGKGEIIGISEENGSGKSTLLKLLVGLLKSKKGTITRTGQLGYSPQDLLLFDNLTVLENFKVFGRGMGLSPGVVEQEAGRIMDRLKFPRYRDTPVKNLSGGTAQKLNFGISLLGDPDILVLDEPYQGMDYSSFLAFWEIQHELRSKDKTVIIVSHLIEDQSKFTRSLHLINKKLQACARKDCPVCCGDEP